MEKISLFGHIFKQSSPQSLNEIFERAQQLENTTVADLAKKYKWSIPKSLYHNRGWIGNLVEFHLGGEQNSKKIDFAKLNLELKTLSLNKYNFPKEHTSLCILNQSTPQNWLSSDVYRKLQNILFVLVEGDNKIPISKRLFGKSVIWTPTAEQLEIIAQDWHEINELVFLGKHDLIKPNLGQILRVSTKGLTGKSIDSAIDAQGKIVFNQPLAFYLRKEFVAHVIFSALSSQINY